MSCGRGFSFTAHRFPLGSSNRKNKLAIGIQEYHGTRNAHSPRWFTQNMLSLFIAESRIVHVLDLCDGNGIASLGCDVVVVQKVVSEFFDANFGKASLLEHLKGQFFTPNGS